MYIVKKQFEVLKMYEKNVVSRNVAIALAAISISFLLV
jgi:hypothetical protein